MAEVALATLAEVEIRQLVAPDFSRGFLETLAGLAETELTPAVAAKVLQDRLRLGIRTYTAVEEGRVIGTASMMIEPKFIHAGGRVAHVEDVVVHPRHRRRGVATLLMRHMEQEAQAAGCYKVIFDCRDEVAPFYETVGYHRHEIQMRKDLT